MSIQYQKGEIKPKVDLVTKWKLEEECYAITKIRDVKTGEEASWPFIKSVDQIAFEEGFLDNVYDPETGQYYPNYYQDPDLMT